MRSFIFAALVSIAVVFAGCKREDQKDIDEALIVEHINANPDLAGAVVTGSGLHYLITDSGSVDHPGISNNVVVYYTGTLLDGTQFDAVNSPAAPLELALGNTILGWQEGIPQFGRGGRGVLLIPSHLGYGATANGSIPKNSVLKFEIELVDFN